MIVLNTEEVVVLAAMATVAVSLALAPFDLEWLPSAAWVGLITIRVCNELWHIGG